MQPSIPLNLGEISWRVARNCSGGSCIRVARSTAGVVIGDSKNPGGAVLSYSRDEWISFVEGVRQGDFDDI